MHERKATMAQEAGAFIALLGEFSYSKFLASFESLQNDDGFLRL